MDIPLVLGGDGIIPGINNNQYINMYWGCCANSRNTYMELTHKWPDGNPSLPTEQAMINYYNVNWGLIGE